MSWHKEADLGTAPKPAYNITPRTGVPSHEYDELLLKAKEQTKLARKMSGRARDLKSTAIEMRKQLHPSK
jgi:hypothetical protein